MSEADDEQVPSFAKIFRFSQVDGRLIVGALPVWTLAVIGVVMACRSLPPPAVALLIGSAVSSFLGIVSAGQQFPHYFVALTPSAALFAAMSLIEMTHGWGTSLRRRLHVEILVLVLGLPAALALLPVYVLSVDKAYEISHPKIDGSRAIDNEAIAAYLASISPPGETFYIVGREPQLYVLADRHPSAYYAWGGAFDTEPETFDRTLQELDARPPRVLVDTSIIEASELDDSDSEGFTDELEADQRAQLEAFLDEQYEFDRQIEHARIYTLR